MRSRTMCNKRSAIAQIARVFLNPDHGVVENPITDADDVDFYGTTTLWCPGLNPIVGLYGAFVWMFRYENVPLLGSD